MTTDEYISCIARDSGEPSCGTLACDEDFDSVHQAYLELQPKGLGDKQFEHALRFRTKRRHVDQARKDGRERTCVDFNFNDLPDTRNTNQVIERKEREHAVRASLDVLTPKQRRVIELIFFERRTQKFAAKVMDCSPQSVNACYHAALSRLGENPILQSFS